METTPVGVVGESGGRPWRVWVYGDQARVARDVYYRGRFHHCEHLEATEFCTGADNGVRRYDWTLAWEQHRQGDAIPSVPVSAFTRDLNLGRLTTDDRAAVVSKV